MILLNDLPRFTVGLSTSEVDISSTDFLTLLNNRSVGNFYGTQGRYSVSLPENSIFTFYRKAVPTISSEIKFYIGYSEVEPTTDARYLLAEINSKSISETIILNTSFTIDYNSLIDQLKNLFPDTDEYFYSIKYHYWNQFLGLDLRYPLDVIDLFCNGNLLSLTFRPEQGEFHLESSKWVDPDFEWAGNTQATVTRILELVLSFI